jgi:hypothetical protein
MILCDREERSEPQLSIRNRAGARHQWLMPVILAVQEAEIRRIMAQSQPRQTVRDPILEKPIAKKGLLEWPKV